MCSCGCKVIFYNSIIHVSTFEIFKSTSLKKKLGNKWKEQKGIFFVLFQLSCNFHGQWVWFASNVWKMAKKKLHFGRRSVTFNCSTSRSKGKAWKSHFYYLDTVFENDPQKVSIYSYLNFQAKNCRIQPVFRHFQWIFFLARKFKLDGFR